MFVLLGLLSLCILTFYIYLTRNFNYWKKRGVAGPTPYPYIGTYPKTFFHRTSNVILESTEIYWQYFRKHRFVGVFESADPTLLVLDPALITDIYVKYFKNFGENTLRDRVNYKKDPLFELHPFLQTGNEWKATRTELTPSYTALKVSYMRSNDQLLKSVLIMTLYTSNRSKQSIQRLKILVNASSPI